MYRYFDVSEFDCKCGCGLNLHKHNHILKLDQARHYAKMAFVINSGTRCIVHNNAVGGKISSPHLSGHATDIRCTDSRSRYLIVSALLRAGFNRIGIAKDFIHVDDSPNKEPDVMWVY